mmetsp:Transcript_58771/g.126291  ORF Transcript_58771/g.126291 Transcript_58771/m.126291 type:complete len:241 (-) Transcript_58771:502-1224(-)
MLKHHAMRPSSSDKLPQGTRGICRATLHAVNRDLNPLNGCATTAGDHCQPHLCDLDHGQGRPRLQGHLVIQPSSIGADEGDLVGREAEATKIFVILQKRLHLTHRAVLQERQPQRRPPSALHREGRVEITHHCRTFNEAEILAAPDFLGTLHQWMWVARPPAVARPGGVELDCGERATGGHAHLLLSISAREEKEFCDPRLQRLGHLLARYALAPNAALDWHSLSLCLVTGTAEPEEYCA